MPASSMAVFVPFICRDTNMQQPAMTVPETASPVEAAAAGEGPVRGEEQGPGAGAAQVQEAAVA
jgi:hypothetical protein